MNFESLVELAIESDASDIHLASGNMPCIRVNGEIAYLENSTPLLNDVVTQIIKKVLVPEAFEEFMETGDIDAAYSYKDICRFRVNAFRQRNGTSLVMRLIKDQIPPIEQLNLPNSINKIFQIKEGLVLVTGPTGSGKSTTLAAIVNEINKTRNEHIITIEDPVEYIHKPIRSLINQREIGDDSATYSTALRSALREDPDVILMGEIRDLESMSIALSAAETGHLVLSTLHTEGAAKTIDRLIDMFPVDRQNQALGQLSTSLKAVISQRLLPRSDISGRIGAFEIMFVNTAISNLIREGKILQIEQVIETSQNQGMITNKKSIDYLLVNGYISQETAKAYSFDAGEKL